MRNKTLQTDAQYTTFIKERNRRPLMATPSQLEMLKMRVLAFPGGQIIFDTPVVVKINRHIELFNCYGAWAERSHGLWLLDGQGQWHEIRHDQQNAGYVIASLNQRIKLLNHERSKVLPEC